jgi:hypothetical protein
LFSKSDFATLSVDKLIFSLLKIRYIHVFL